MAREWLGEFEQVVLLASLRLGDTAHTMAVAEEIEAVTAREVSHAAVYVALRRMEDKGFVTSCLGDATPARGGRPKRFFTVMPAGLHALSESRNALMSLWKGLHEQIGGALRVP